MDNAVKMVKKQLQVIQELKSRKMFQHEGSLYSLHVGTQIYITKFKEIWKNNPTIKFSLDLRSGFSTENYNDQKLSKIFTFDSCVIWLENFSKEKYYEMIEKNSFTPQNYNSNEKQCRIQLHLYGNEIRVTVSSEYSFRDNFISEYMDVIKTGELIYPYLEKIQDIISLIPPMFDFTEWLLETYVKKQIECPSYPLDHTLRFNFEGRIGEYRVHSFILNSEFFREHLLTNRTTEIIITNISSYVYLLVYLYTNSVNARYIIEFEPEILPDLKSIAVQLKLKQLESITDLMIEYTQFTNLEYI